MEGFFNFFFPALLYSAFGVIIEKTRGAEDDLNTIAAGTLTGMLYKSTGRVAKYFSFSFLVLILVIRILMTFAKYCPALKIDGVKMAVSSMSPNPQCFSLNQALRKLKENLHKKKKIQLN